MFVLIGNRFDMTSNAVQIANKSLANTHADFITVSLARRSQRWTITVLVVEPQRIQL
jgi:hypothetical protein